MNYRNTTAAHTLAELFEQLKPTTLAAIIVDLKDGDNWTASTDIRDVAAALDTGLTTLFAHVGTDAGKQLIASAERNAIAFRNHNR